MFLKKAFAVLLALAVLTALVLVTGKGLQNGLSIFLRPLYAGKLVRLLLFGLGADRGGTLNRYFRR